MTRWRWWQWGITIVTPGENTFDIRLTTRNTRVLSGPACVQHCCLPLPSPIGLSGLMLTLCWRSLADGGQVAGRRDGWRCWQEVDDLQSTTTCTGGVLKCSDARNVGEGLGNLEQNLPGSQCQKSLIKGGQKRAHGPERRRAGRSLNPFTAMMLVENGL